MTGLHRSGSPSEVVRAWSRPARAAAGALVALGRATPPLLALAFARDTTLEPRVIVGVLLGLGALPGLAAHLLGRVFAASIESDDAVVRVRRADVSIEIPRDSLVALEAWRVPLPGAGVTLRLRSGAAAPVGLEPPTATLAEALGIPVPAHPNLVFAAARRAAPLAAARHPLLRFGLFGLVPTGLLFRAQQVIGFGGLFGQIRMEGLGPWLESLAVTWASALVGLVLFASAVRAAGEIAAYALAWIAPRRATPVRRGVEWGVAVAYYLGTPGYLAYRLLGF